MSNLRRPSHGAPLRYRFLRGVQGVLQKERLQQEGVQVSQGQELYDVEAKEESLSVLQIVEMFTSWNEQER